MVQVDEVLPAVVPVIMAHTVVVVVVILAVVRLVPVGLRVAVDRLFMHLPLATQLQQVQMVVVR